MRILYWLLALVSLGLGAAGLVLFASPDNPNVALDALDEWYFNRTVVAALIGAVLGGVAGAFPVRKLVRSKVGESASQFHNRVIFWGFVAGAASVLAASGLAWVSALSSTDWQLSSSERATLALGSGRFWAVPAAAWLLSAIAFAAGVSATDWKGKTALIRSN